MRPGHELLGKALSLGVVVALCSLAWGGLGRHQLRHSPDSSAARCNVDSLASIRYLSALEAVHTAAGRGLHDLLADTATGALATVRGVPRVVATLSWVGPLGGALVLMTCSGRVLSTAEIGHVKGFQLRHVTGDTSPEAIVDQLTGSGTGWRERTTAVYGLIGDSINLLWSGISFQGSYQAEVLGGAWELRAAIAFPSPGRIVRTARRMPLTYNKDKKIWEPRGRVETSVEVFVWDAQAKQFVPAREG
jgi:hypothetical protein